MSLVRYGYAITTGALIAGTVAAMALNAPASVAQVAQNAPSALPATPPRAGAPLSFADLAARLQPAVVNISTRQRVAVQNNPLAGTPFADLFGGGRGGGSAPQTREQQSLGSGFLISDDGYIVTNNHVISNGNPQSTGPVGQITVTLSDRKEYAARLVGRDGATDIAVLKIEARGLPFVNFGDSSRARVGDWVVAIGNPFNVGSTVTAGIISAMHRNIGSGPYERFIQTDASINRGNSGGPLFDLYGNVIGINSSIFSPTGGSVGIGFAIPAELAKPVVDTLRGGARVKRGYLGIGIKPVDQDIADALGIPKRGEFVERVEPGQPGERAGLRPRDIVLRVNNRDVTADETLSYIVGTLPVGTRVPIEIVRDGRRQTLNAVLGERPPEEQLAGALPDDAMPGDTGAEQGTAATALGVLTQPLTATIARQIGVPEGTTGLVIAQVQSGTDAETKGLRRGDVIVSVNDRKVTTSAELAQAVAQAKAAGRASVLLYVQRGARTQGYIGVRLK